MFLVQACWPGSCYISLTFCVSLSVSQLVKMRLGVPCRVLTCAHLQCFDAVFFLQMNEKKPTWTCPVCDKPAPFELLTIDGWGLLKPGLTSLVCSFLNVGASCWTVIQPTVFSLSKEFHLLVGSPGEGVYLWFVVSLLLPSCLGMFAHLIWFIEIML